MPIAWATAQKKCDRQGKDRQLRIGAQPKDIWKCIKHCSSYFLLHYYRVHEELLIFEATRVWFASLKTRRIEHVSANLDLNTSIRKLAITHTPWRKCDCHLLKLEKLGTTSTQITGSDNPCIIGKWKEFWRNTERRSLVLNILYAFKVCGYFFMTWKDFRTRNQTTAGLHGQKGWTGGYIAKS